MEDFRPPSVDKKRPRTKPGAFRIRSSPRGSGIQALRYRLVELVADAAHHRVNVLRLEVEGVAARCRPGELVGFLTEAIVIVLHAEDPVMRQPVFVSADNPKPGVVV